MWSWGKKILIILFYQASIFYLEETIASLQSLFLKELTLLLCITLDALNQFKVAVLTLMSQKIYISNKLCLLYIHQRIIKNA